MIKTGISFKPKFKNFMDVSFNHFISVYVENFFNFAVNNVQNHPRKCFLKKNLKLRLISSIGVLYIATGAHRFSYLQGILRNYNLTLADMTADQCYTDGEQISAQNFFGNDQIRST